MSLTTSISGALLGVGTVAVLPFTGKGSVFGNTTLTGSLSGWGTLLLAVGAGAAGAYAGEHLDEAQKVVQRHLAKTAAERNQHLRLVG